MRGSKNFILILAAVLVFSYGGSYSAEARAGTRYFTPKRINGKYKNVKKPADYTMKKGKALSLRDRGITVDLYGRDFAQGNIIYIEIQADRDLDDLTCRYGRKKVPLTRRSWGYRGFFAIHPETRPGKKLVRLRGKAGEKSFRMRGYFKVARSPFPYRRRALDLGKYSDVEYQRRPENIALIKKCAKKKRKAFSVVGGDRLGPDLSHPRDMHYITSPFWSKRTYMRYKIRKGKKIRLKNRIRVHRGLDLRGHKGTPVYSLAAGRVVLAEELYYEGNMVIIDHGNRIFSYFMHLNELKVKKGDIIRGGKTIGTVGSTGVSTAAHLHVSLLVRGVQVDPLSILYLPVRE